MKNRNLISTLIIMTSFVFGQAVTGFVGEGDKPLVGANVVIEGTQNGGVTDDKGKFIIETSHPDSLYEEPDMKLVLTILTGIISSCDS